MQPAPATFALYSVTLPVLKGNGITNSSKAADTEEAEIMPIKKPQTFKQFPKEYTCPVCKRNDNLECVILPVTGKNGQLAPVHLWCAAASHCYKDLLVIYRHLDTAVGIMKKPKIKPFPKECLCPVCGTNESTESVMLEVLDNEKPVGEMVPVHLWCSICNEYSENLCVKRETALLKHQY